MLVEKLILSVALAHGIDPTLFKAILMQESSLRHDVVSSTGDIGIGQISPPTARAYGCNIKKLATDVEYNLHCSARILADLKRRHKKCHPTTWHTFYHSSNDVLRFRYKVAVSRWVNN